MSTGTTPLCGYCGKPVIDAITWHAGTPYHSECTHGPGYPTHYVMTRTPTPTWPSTLTEDDVRRIVREELAHNTQIQRAR